MDFDRIRQNLMNALSQLMALRLIVSSPNKKVADLPAAYVLAAAIMAPWVCGAALLLGFLFRYGARFEKDATRM